LAAVGERPVVDDDAVNDGEQARPEAKQYLLGVQVLEFYLLADAKPGPIRASITDKFSMTVGKSGRTVEDGAETAEVVGVLLAG
jgi:hypothetical protein